MPDYLYLDIETIPTQDEAKRTDIVASASPPANYKNEETIAKWREENGKELIAKTSFNGGLGHICQICAVCNDRYMSAMLTSNISNEKTIVEMFADFIETTSAYTGFDPVIVGHNVNNFDIRFIWQRAIVLGVKLPRWFPKDPKPWGKDTVDTMTAWAGKRGFVSLDDLASYLGIKAKQGVDGSMVAEMWTAGKHKEIADYCMADVHLTKAIHERMMEAGL